jgi:uncharacterized protein (TIGR00269 family)
MKCSKCLEKSIVFRRDSNTHLCESHFVDAFEETVKHTIEDNNMIVEGDRIAVALSGGKDSTALIYVLNKILSKRKNISVFAITIDEGIKGYREDTIKSARNISGNLGIDHIIVSFKERYGLDLDEMIEARREAPCTFCGVFRKSLLNMTAKELGATKVATGHDLDDEAQSIMMNYLKGDIERLGRFAPRRLQPGLIPRVKPLKDIPERETALYCMVHGFYLKMAECPYASLSFRSDVRDMLNYLENNFPGTKKSTISGFSRISNLLTDRYPPMRLSSCEQCKEPCVENSCKACQLLGKIASSRLTASPQFQS